jgi:hypothetical protein
MPWIEPRVSFVAAIISSRRDSRAGRRVGGGAQMLGEDGIADWGSSRGSSQKPELMVYGRATVEGAIPGGGCRLQHGGMGTYDAAECKSADAILEYWLGVLFLGRNQEELDARQ